VPRRIHGVWGMIKGVGARKGKKSAVQKQLTASYSAKGGEETTSGGLQGARADEARREKIGAGGEAFFRLGREKRERRKCFLPWNESMSAKNKKGFPGGKASGGLITRGGRITRGEEGREVIRRKA